LKVSNERQIKYSRAIVFADATVDQLQLGGCNDPIAIVVGDGEGCHFAMVRPCGVANGVANKEVCAKHHAFTR
jgi:hypothetical protein